MEKFLSIIFGMLMLYLIINFWWVLLIVIVSAYLFSTIISSLPFYFESYKKFLNKVKNVFWNKFLKG